MADRRNPVNGGNPSGARAARDQILIIGAGAIGRGFLPWVFPPGRYDLVYVDVKTDLVNLMQTRRSFTSWRVRDGRLDSLTVPVAGVFHSSDFRPDSWEPVKAIFINVGPRQVSRAAELCRGSRCPVILCENDPESVAAVRAVLDNDRVYFAVPDVITSNTAPPSLLAQDPLAITTEDGQLFVDARVDGIDGDLCLLPEKELLHQQWTAKLYLHNTPHCVAAYLGALCDVSYVHEAMAIPEVEATVEGVMYEMLSALKLRWEIPHAFLEWYAQKELARFRCSQLFDPIARVAREPLRKLDPDGRLMGAAQICLAEGFVPHQLLIGIGSALLFANANDADTHLLFMRRALPADAFVTHVLNLRRGEALERVLRERLAGIIEHLEALALRARATRTEDRSA